MAKHTMRFIDRNTNVEYSITSSIKKDGTRSIIVCTPSDETLKRQWDIEVIEHEEIGEAVNEIENVITLKADTSKSMADFTKIRDEIKYIRNEISDLLREVKDEAEKVNELLRKCKNER